MLRVDYSQYCRYLILLLWFNSFIFMDSDLFFSNSSVSVVSKYFIFPFFCVILFASWLTKSRFLIGVYLLVLWSVFNIYSILWPFYFLTPELDLLGVAVLFMGLAGLFSRRGRLFDITNYFIFILAVATWFNFFNKISVPSWREGRALLQILSNNNFEYMISPLGNFLFRMIHESFFYILNYLYLLAHCICPFLCFFKRTRRTACLILAVIYLGMLIFFNFYLVTIGVVAAYLGATMAQETQQGEVSV